MPYKVGDKAKIKYQDNAGYWSVVITMVLEKDSFYEAETDGVIIPPPELRKFSPIKDSNGICKINVFEADLVKRDEQPGDDEKREAWRSTVAAAKVAAEEAKVVWAAEMQTRYSHIVPGTKVTWRGSVGWGPQERDTDFNGTVVSKGEDHYCIVDIGYGMQQTVWAPHLKVLV